MPIYPAIVLGAAASATAPAATVLVIREYRASGMLTELLLKVVAIDDAWCLIFAAMAIAVGNAMRADVFQMSIVFAGLGEIFGALLVGGILGYLSSKLSKFIRTREELLIYTLGLVLFNVGLSIALEVSVLLSSMMMGLVMVNMARENYKFFEVLRSVDTPLFLAFFIISGAHLDFGILYKMGIAGMLYVVFRTIGKVYGAKLGAKLSGAPKVVGDWLGLGLTPQAGVALGIGLVAKTTFPELGNYIFTIIAATSVVFELVGPLLTKYSLIKAGEIVSTE
jgi:Kef-type K+ transport system membrane component KefB